MSFCMYMYQYICILNTSPTRSLSELSASRHVFYVQFIAQQPFSSRPRVSHEGSSFQSLQLEIDRWRRSHVANNMRSCKKTDVGAVITNTVEYVLVPMIDPVNYHIDILAE